MISLGVQDAKNNHAVAFNAVEKLVRETVGEQPAEVAIVDGTSLRVFLQQVNRLADFLEQLITQTDPSGLIPIPGFPRVRLCIGPDDDAPTHERVGLRSRASTSAQLDPA